MPIPLVSNYLKRVYNNSNHNSDQIELFSLSLGFIPLVAAVGASCPGWFILPPPPPPTWVLKFIFLFAHSSCFKLSVHEAISFIIISQVKNKVFFFVIWSHTLSCRGGGASGQGGLSCPPPPPPPPTYLGIIFFFFFFNAHSTCFKLSIHEVVSFIIIIQVKLSCFLCRSV